MLHHLRRRDETESANTFVKRTSPLFTSLTCPANVVSASRVTSSGMTPQQAVGDVDAVSFTSTADRHFGDFLTGVDNRYPMLLVAYMRVNLEASLFRFGFTEDELN